MNKKIIEIVLVRGVILLSGCGGLTTARDLSGGNADVETKVFKLDLETQKLFAVEW